MRLDPPPEPITEDDGAILAALRDADVPALLAAVAHATGDVSVLRDEFRPVQALILEPAAGLDEATQDAARRVAAEALARFRDAGSPPCGPPTPELRQRLFEFLIGDALTDDYATVLREELAFGDEDLRAPAWHKDDIAPDRDFTVAIVGSGMSGLAAAHRLQQAGVAFVIFEKNDDIGGTWYENSYPGCRVDVPNHLYSYSFAQTGDWPQYFSSQDVLLDYFRTCADAFGLRPHIRFGTEVVAATFDDEAENWSVQVRTGSGSGLAEEVLTFDVVVSAVGQLNRPSFPAVPGRDCYAGPSFHSARWDHDVDLAGKRVGIIGTGASAMQFIPPVAEQAASVVVFQRTPAWLLPTPEYLRELPAGLQWVLRHVPAYARWDRLWIFWRMHEGLLPMATVDPEWPDQARSVSMFNEFLRQMLSAYLDLQFADPDLRAQVQPDYPPGAKRFVRDNGTWARTLARDDVELVSGTLSAITEKGVVTGEGVEHQVDVLIYGTGFQASRFLTPMTVTGRAGADLHERWDGDARAYLGITVPEFPNMFLLYGPNTNIVLNGSIVYFAECEVHYVVECVRLLLERGHRSMECRPEVHDVYNERIDEGNLRMAWGASTVHSWYKNARGRVAQNWPFSLLEYWQQTRTPDPADYTLR